MAHAYYKIAVKDNIDKDTLDNYNKITQIVVMSGYDNYIRTGESGNLSIIIDSSEKSGYSEELNCGYTLRIKASNKEEYTTELLKLMATVLSNKYLQKELLSSCGIDFRQRYNRPANFLYAGLHSWLYKRLADRSLPYLHINLLKSGSVPKVSFCEIRANKPTIENIAFDLGSGASYCELVSTYGYNPKLSRELENLGYILDTYYNQLVKAGNVDKLCYIALLAEIRYVETILK